MGGPLLFDLNLGVVNSTTSKQPLDRRRYPQVLETEAVAARRIFQEERLLAEQVRGVGVARCGNGSRGRHAWAWLWLDRESDYESESERREPLRRWSASESLKNFGLAFFLNSDVALPDWVGRRRYITYRRCLGPVLYLDSYVTLVLNSNLVLKK